MAGATNAFNNQETIAEGRRIGPNDPEFPARAGAALWRALVEGVPYYVGLLSVEGRLLYVNHSLSGATPESITGRSIFELISARAESVIRPAFERIISRPGSEEVDFPYTRDEETRWIHVVLNAVQGADGERLGVLAIGHDITETHQTGIELRMSVNALHRLVEAREQMAADLHDGILQSLYGIGLRLEAARTDIADNPLVRGQLDEVIGQVKGSMAEMRRFIQDERATGSPTASWEETLAGVLHGLEVAGGPRLRLQVPRSLAARVPESFRTEIVFVVREAVSNAMRHSAGTQVAVRLLDQGDRLRLEVEDDGRGLDTKVSPEGLGLLNMPRRASQMGATLTIHSNPGTGTLVRLALPPTGAAE